MTNPGNRPFNRFLIVWSGQFISSIGSGLTAFSLGIYAWEKTQSATVWSLHQYCTGRAISQPEKTALP